MIADVDGGVYAGGQLDPQCSTFSAARGLRGGPAPLRGAEGRALYGIPDLSPEDRIKVKTDTLLAIRCAIICMALHRLGRPFVLENPAPRKSMPSLFNLDEYVKLAALPGVRFTVFVQCPTGSYSSKSAGILHYIVEAPRRWFPAACPHEKQWFRFEDGSWHWGSHPPLLGKQLAVPADVWTPALRTQVRDKRRGRKTFISHDAAHYTGELNRRLTSVMKRATAVSHRRHLRKRLHCIKEDIAQPLKRKALDRYKVQMPERLT